MNNIIFIHGLESSGQGFKGNLFRKINPEILTPDFTSFNPAISLEALLKRRMSELEKILKNKTNWIIIGSSFGGLMASIFTLQNPNKVKLLILLAPFLNTTLLKVRQYSSVDVPVIIYHGKNDNIVSPEKSQEIAKLLFTNLTYKLVEDDHQLHKTVSKLDWNSIFSFDK